MTELSGFMKLEMGAGGSFFVKSSEKLVGML